PRTPAARTRLAAVLLPVLVVGALLAGCGNEDDARSTDEETAVQPNEESPSESTSPSPGEDEKPTVPGADSPIVKRSIEDLAEREQVEASSIEVVAVEEVTWRDGSLGCAKEDMMYTQALVDGQRITLRIDGTDFEY